MLNSQRLISRVFRKSFEKILTSSYYRSQKAIRCILLMRVITRFASEFLFFLRYPANRLVAIISEIIRFGLQVHVLFVGQNLACTATAKHVRTNARVMQGELEVVNYSLVSATRSKKFWCKCTHVQQLYRVFKIEEGNTVRQQLDCVVMHLFLQLLTHVLLKFAIIT